MPYEEIVIRITYHYAQHSFTGAKAASTQGGFAGRNRVERQDC